MDSSGKNSISSSNEKEHQIDSPATFDNNGSVGIIDHNNDDDNHQQQHKVETTPVAATNGNIELASTGVIGDIITSNHHSSKGNEDKKIFVGGIAYDVTNEDLTSYFSQFGEVSQVQVKYDRNTGRSRGFAFVEFATGEACKTALNSREQMIKNKQVEVKPAKSRENKKVFVGGLPADHPEDELRQHFEQYGKVEDIEWPFDKQTKARRNFAFIVFEEEEAADRASCYPKQMFGSRECDVKKAVPQGKRFGPIGIGGRGGAGTWRGAYGAGTRGGNWFGGSGGWGQVGGFGHYGSGGWGDWYAGAGGLYGAASSGYGAYGGGYYDDYSSNNYSDYWGGGTGATSAYDSYSTPAQTGGATSVGHQGRGGSGGTTNRYQQQQHQQY